MLIYKVLRDREWQALRDAGESAGSPDDRRDGFVHLSTGAQLAGTLRRHFAGESGLWLLALEAEALGPALRWEVSRGRARFPHLHGPLRLADVGHAAPLGLDTQGEPRLPPEDGS